MANDFRGAWLYLMGLMIRFKNLIGLILLAFALWNSGGARANAPEECNTSPWHSEPAEMRWQNQGDEAYSFKTATGQTRQWHWSYNAQGLVATATEPGGGVWTYDYDALGNRSSERNPLGQQTRYTYDAAGRVVESTAPNGLVSTISYDVQGRVLASTSAGENTRYSYTPTGQVGSVQLPNGQQINYGYDAVDRLIAITDNRGNRVSYTLDVMGNRVREEVRDTSGNLAWATGRNVNQLNKVASQQAALGQTTRLSYDANGQLTSIADPLGQSTSQSLDGLGRPVVTTLADNSQARQSWDQLGQLSSVTDPKGIPTRYERNAFGEVVAEISPDSGTTRYQRDSAGRVTTKTDALGQVTQYQYDSASRLVQATQADASVQHYSYDASGSLLGGSNQSGYLSEITDSSGSTRYERDLLGRITRKTQTVNDNPANPSSLDVSYSYSGGQLSAITYPSGLKVSYPRNAAGQISGVDIKEPGRLQSTQPFITELSHTALGQPKAWRWASGDSAQRSFDPDGRMSASDIASYQYDAAGRITSVTQNLWASTAANPSSADLASLYTTAVTWSANYDSRNRLIAFSRPGADSRYSWDANSNRLSSIDTTTADIDLDGRFDADDYSLSTAQSTRIDPASNRLLGFTQTLTQTKAGRTLSASTAQVGYSVDAAGNLTSDGLRSFGHDTANRLNQVSIGLGSEAARTRYLHNALGQRVFKSEVQAQTLAPDETELGSTFVDWLKQNFGWLYAQAQSNTTLGDSTIYADNPLPEWALLGQYGNGAAKSAGRLEYIWLPTEDGNAIPVGLYRNGKLYAVHSDHLGTPRLITNEDKRPVWQWPYSAFGANAPTGILKATKNAKQAYTTQPVLLKATQAPLEYNLRYPGQYYDEESQLSYNYQRSYQAGQGRYTQADPIGLNGGWNRFGYVGGNPVSYVDPEGLNPAAGAYTGAAIGSSFGPVGTAVGAGLGFATGTWLGWNLVGPMLANSLADEAQKDLDNQNYHNTCDKPPPPGLSQCELARWQYRQGMSCQKKRQDWEDRWGIPQSKAPHERALANVKNRLKNAAADIARYCTCP